MDKCICHLFGYQIKDATARAQITELDNKVNNEISQQLTALDTKVNEDIATQINTLDTKVNEDITREINELREEIIGELGGDY